MVAGVETGFIRVNFLDLEVTLTHFGRRSGHRMPIGYFRRRQTQTG